MDGIKDVRSSAGAARPEKDSDEWRAQALVFRGKRQAMLASNIANADTPNYKARDISFADVLKASSLAEDSADRSGQEQSPAREVPLIPTSTLAFAGYRRPTQDSIDGNTVELDQEQAEFARNAILYTLAMTSMDDEAQEFKQAASLPNAAPSRRG